MSLFLPSGVHQDGHFYGFDGDSHNSRIVTLTCLDAATGTSLWKQRGLGCGSLMIVDGRLLALSDQGDLVLIEASPEGYRELARSPFLEGAMLDSAYCVRWQSLWEKCGRQAGLREIAVGVTVMRFPRVL